MARPSRGDGPGVWHHVMNRGIARRTVFEDNRDVRYFLSRLARAVRAGGIEVHAYCVLTTHFHLLVRSSDEGLSRAMGRVLNDYVRWFNRGRKRDGPLFRGRFRSRPVDSLEYRRRLVRYIDSNAVLARLVPTPVLYPHGSARRYACSRGPIWLERSWIEEDVRQRRRESRYDPQLYVAAFGDPISPSLARVIERRIESGARSPDPLDDLLDATPERVLDWMRRKVALADGTCLGLPVCDPADIVEVLAAERALRPDWRLPPLSARCGVWQILEVALLRELCGASLAEIGLHIDLSDQGALRAYRHHVRALSELPEYAEVAGRLAALAIARCYGPYGARLDHDASESELNGSR
jgi:REP element-mobilizing transposase RayT